MNDYWSRRKHLQYYQRVIEYAQQYCPDGKMLLDVGGGIGRFRHAVISTSPV